MSNWIGIAYCDNCKQNVDVYWNNEYAECGFCGKKLKVKIEVKK